GRNAARVSRGLPAATPPRTTAVGALAYYVSHANARHYEPSNITFGIMPPLDRPPKSRQERQLAISERALQDLAVWIREAFGPEAPADQDSSTPTADLESAVAETAPESGARGLGPGA